MIIGLTGPICAGKDESVNILVKMGFERFSLSDEIRAMMRKEGIELTRQTIQEYGDMLRRKEGTGIWARKVIAKLHPGKNYVVNSIRHPGEVEEFRNINGFHLIKIDAPTRLRFARMVKRGREQDPKTFEQFQMLELKDLGVGQPDYGQQHAQCFALADETIVNEGTIEKLREKLTDLVEQLKNNGKKF